MKLNEIKLYPISGTRITYYNGRIRVDWFECLHSNIYYPSIYWGNMSFKFVPSLRIAKALAKQKHQEFLDA